MGAGKTWCADYLATYHGYSRFSLAGKLKNIARELFDVQDKSDRSRHILQSIGISMRDIESDVWIKYVLKNIKERSENKPVVVDDLRFQNEADWFSANGFQLVLVTVDEQLRQQRLAALYPDMDQSRQRHASEAEWSFIEPDFVLESINAKETTKQIDRILENVTSRARWEE